MPETKTVRRRTNLDQLRRLYANRPVVADSTSSNVATNSHQSVAVDVTRRYLRKDIIRTLIVVAFFLIIFAVLYLLQGSDSIQQAIAWVGVRTGF